MGESTQLSGEIPDNPPTLRTLRLELQYDGTDFSGWQVQPGRRTVQGELERVLRSMLRDPALDVIGSGRTDAGVHAMAQVAHVRTQSSIAAQSVMMGLNSGLDPDLRVVRVRDAPRDFHARYSAISKEYRYHFWQGRFVPPFLRRYVYPVFRPVDSEAMNEAAQLLIGTHDMSSFRAAGCTARGPVRTVHSAVVARHEELVVFAILGNGFLQHMVRILAGTLLGVGRGRLSVAQVSEIIAARDRDAAPATAPARGLWLAGVQYEGQPGALAACATPLVTLPRSSLD